MGSAIVLGCGQKVLTLCEAVLVAMFVDFLQAVKFSLRIGILEEQDGVLLGVFWPLPSGLASGASSEHLQL